MIRISLDVCCKIKIRKVEGSILFLMNADDVRTLLLFSWNVQDLSLQNKRAKVNNFISSENPDIVSIQEIQLAIN
jgi:hypothetical protein